MKSYWIPLLVAAICLIVFVSGIKRTGPAPSVLERIAQTKDSVKTVEPGDLIGFKNQQSQVSWALVTRNNTGGLESKDDGGCIYLKSLYADRPGEFFLSNVDTNIIVMKENNPSYVKAVKLFLKNLVVEF